MSFAAKLRWLCSMIALCGVGCNPSWSKFEPTGGGFSILLPGMPDEASLTIETTLGPLELRTFTVVLNESLIYLGRGFYSVSYADLPIETLDAAIRESLLDSARQRVASGEDSGISKKLLSEHMISTGAYEATEFVVEVSEGMTDTRMTVKRRVLLTPTKLYELTVGGRTEAESEDAERFFRSFKLL